MITFIQVIILSLFLLVPNCAFAKEYRWKVTGVIDGDTLRIENKILPSELRLSIRLRGIDAPESNWRAKCTKEKELGNKAKEFVINRIRNADDVYFTNIKWGKYGGRVLADVYVDGKDLSSLLLKKELVRRYHGGKKKSWCTRLLGII